MAFNIGDRVMISPDFYEPNLQNLLAEVSGLPNTEHPNQYQVKVIQGYLAGTGVGLWIPANALKAKS